MRYGLKWPEYAKQWDRMEIKKSRADEFARYAKKITDHAAIYQDCESATGVPWYMIGCLHLRESDMDFGTYLGNGDSLKRPTRHVPKGRGPFKTFVAGAIDAIKIEGWGDIRDWRLEKMLYYSELFNGAGYDHHGLPSPYIWGGTNVQRRGKFVGDGVFDPSAWDSQPGVAPILSLVLQSNSITPRRED